ncbi:uncharacterized protein LOC134853831 isoform X2 [Symsagittifera roscoffensis]
MGNNSNIHRTPIIRTAANCALTEENVRPMSPASSEISSSIFSDSQSECYGVTPSSAGIGSPLLNMHQVHNLSSTPGGFAVLPSKKQLPTYIKSVQQNAKFPTHQPPPIPPKKAPPPYAPPPPPGATSNGTVDRQRPNRNAPPPIDQSRYSPSKRSSGGSSGGGGSVKSGDELSSTLKNSLSVNSFAAFDRMTPKNGSDEEAMMNEETSNNVQIHDISTKVTSSQQQHHQELQDPSPSPTRKESMGREVMFTSSNGDGASAGGEKKVKKQSANAYKFYMEQHMESVMSFPLQREKRRHQVEQESIGSSDKDEMLGSFHKHESNLLRRRRCKVSIDDFREIDQLGVGGFGEVKLVRSAEDAQLYAMKVLNKRHILKKNQAGHVRAERDILAQADNEWVVKLFLSFQDKHNLYLLMEFIPGGDLMSLLIKKDYFPEPMARFYTAEMILAIQYVHELGFIHRDIKPDNILIDKEGHIKLTDFGLCTGFKWTHSSKYYQNGKLQDDNFEMDDEEWEKMVQQECNCCTDNNTTADNTQPNKSNALHGINCEQENGGADGTNECKRVKPLDRYKRLQRHRCLAHSLVGTPNYIAPELLMKVPYDKSCDWWSVGVILYEMVLGRPPFCAETPADTQYRVLNWKKYLRIPRDIIPISHNCVDFIQHICRDQRNRLGSRSVDELKNHPFLSCLPFEELRTTVAPYIPEIKHEMDTQHFQSEDGHLMAKPVNNSDYQPDHTLKHPDHAFYEFTYRRPMPNFPNSAGASPELTSAGFGKIPKSKSVGSGLTSKLFKSSTNLTDLELSKESEADEIDGLYKHNSQKSGTSMAKKFFNGLRSFKSSENLVDENCSSGGHDQTFLSGTSQGSSKSSSRKEKTKNSTNQVVSNNSQQHQQQQQQQQQHHRRHSSELAMEVDQPSNESNGDYVMFAQTQKTYQSNGTTYGLQSTPAKDQSEGTRNNLNKGYPNPSQGLYQLTRPPPVNAPLRKNFGTDIECETSQNRMHKSGFNPGQPVLSSSKKGSSINRNQRNDDILTNSSQLRNHQNVNMIVTQSSSSQRISGGAGSSRQKYEQNLNMFLSRPEIAAGGNGSQEQRSQTAMYAYNNMSSRDQRCRSVKYEDDEEECYV